MGVANLGAHPAHMSVESPKFGPDGSSSCVLPTPDTGSLLPLPSPPPPRPGGASRGRGVSYVHCGTIRRGCVPTIRSRLRLSVARRGRVRGRVRGQGRSRSRSRGRVRGRGRRQPTAHPEAALSFRSRRARRGDCVASEFRCGPGQQVPYSADRRRCQAALVPMPARVVGEQ
jgi:hypothetical protein